LIGTRRVAFALLAVAFAAFPDEGSAAQRAGSKPSALTEVNDRFTAQNNPWFNSLPLSGALLQGKVVLVNFWTYSCINSLRALPYTRSWARTYGNAGLVVIGVHTPEFSIEKESVNVEQAVRDLKVPYPVVVDSDYEIWQAFNNARCCATRSSRSPLSRKSSSTRSTPCMAPCVSRLACDDRDRLPPGVIVIVSRSNEHQVVCRPIS
jgi:thiol-disulfide isomerase/thioredoxin